MNLSSGSDHFDIGMYGNRTYLATGSVTRTSLIEWC